MNITCILEESPNGYKITSEAPTVMDDAIRYSLVIMDRYPIEEFPVEFGIINYAFGKLLMGDTTKPKISEERAKRIENALYHLNQSLHVFNHSDYPIMFGIISIMMAKLFRERATLISNRSFLAERSSPEDSVLYGVDQVLEAFPIFFKSKTHVIEHAICSLEAGWLYVLQSEFLDNYRDDSIREQAAMYLERTISLIQSISGKDGKAEQLYTLPGEKSSRWNPLTAAPADFPDHIRLLLDGEPFSFIEGSALYLLGRLYQGWIELTVSPSTGATHHIKGHEKLHAKKSKNVKSTTEADLQISAEEFELQNQEKCFEYFSKCVRPKYLPKDCFLWADAHHRTAVTLIKYPKVVNPDYDEHDINSSDIHLEVAMTHLNLALRCATLTNPASMDLHFHLAQTAISRLQIIIDRIPMGQSVTKTLATHSEGLELIQLVEEHLEEARKRVTPASTQTTQDGYLYYFSCLKISEFRMLEAACKPQLQRIEREVHFTDAVEHVIDALNSRSLTDNTDLHYVASVQMSQLLLAVKRSYAAAKSYAKCIFTLSLIINRSLFNPEDVQAKLSEETVRQVGQSLAAGAKDVPWVKLHFGPVSLNEKVTAGYASWSFEETENVKLSESSSSNLFDFSGGSFDNNVNDDQYKNKNGSNNSNINSSKIGIADNTPNYKATPPKGVPPLKLPIANNKKIYVSGESMPDVNPQSAALESDKMDILGLRKKKPPPGGVPLYAMGHMPKYDANSNSAGNETNNYFLGPYGKYLFLGY